MLHLLGAFVRVNASRVAAVVGVFLAKNGGVLDLVLSRAVKLFFEHWLLIDCFKLGLEVVESLSAAVGSSSLVDEVVARVVSFVRECAPA